MLWYLRQQYQIKVLPSFSIVPLLLIPIPAVLVLLKAYFPPNRTGFVMYLIVFSNKLLLRGYLVWGQQWLKLTSIEISVCGSRCSQRHRLYGTFNRFLDGSFLGLCHKSMGEKRSLPQGGSEQQRQRPLHFPLLKFMRFLLTHFSRQSRSLWIVAQPSGASATPPSFVSSVTLLWVNSCPTIQV